VQAPKPAGQVLGAGHPLRVAAACIAEGFPVSAAASMAGVGSMSRSTLAGGASAGPGCSGEGSGAAIVQADRLIAAATDMMNPLVTTRTSKAVSRRDANALDSRVDENTILAYLSLQSTIN
jgi:hypothetical protein